MGTQLPPEQTAHHHQPVFGPCLLWPNGWMDEDATWYGSRPRTRPHCVRRGPRPPRKGNSSPPSFRSMTIVTTVAHLSYCWALVLNAVNEEKFTIVGGKLSYIKSITFIAAISQLFSSTVTITYLNKKYVPLNNIGSLPEQVPRREKNWIIDWLRFYIPLDTK